MRGRRREYSTVQDEVSRSDVVRSQLRGVVDDQSALQVPGAELNGDVNHVDYVSQDVGGKPDGVGPALELRKRFASDARPQVVQYLRRTLQSSSSDSLRSNRDDAFIASQSWLTKQQKLIDTI